MLTLTSPVAVVAALVASPLNATSHAALVNVVVSQTSYEDAYNYSPAYPAFHFHPALTQPNDVQSATFTAPNFGTATGSITGTYSASGTGFSSTTTGHLISPSRSWASVFTTNVVTFSVSEAALYTVGFRSQFFNGERLDVRFAFAASGSTLAASSRTNQTSPTVVNMTDLTGTAFYNDVYAHDQQFLLQPGISYTVLVSGIMGTSSYGADEFGTSTISVAIVPEATSGAGALMAAGGLVVRRRRSR